MVAVDPVMLEIIRYGLLQAMDEMKIKLIKTSIDKTIYVSKDFSCGIFNERGDLVAQSLGLPHFVANLQKSILSSADDIGGFDKFEDGDVYLTNDPYRVVAHVPDIDIFMPIFHEGELVGFTASRAHWADIGASKGFITNAREVYEEGVLLPSVRAYRNGEPDPSVLRILRANSRMPETSEGNLRAQVAASLAGKQRLLAFIEKFGVDTFRSAMDSIMEHAEAIARKRILTIPDGVYTGEGYVDDDTIHLGEPLKVAVKVTVDSDEMVVDLTGSNDKTEGSMNIGRQLTETVCRMGLCYLMPVGFPINQGIFRPLRIIIPDGSMFAAEQPSATTLGYHAGDIACDLIRTVLAEAMPESTCAPNYGGACNSMITGYGPDRAYFFVVGINAGGGGAKPNEDGEDALIFGDLANVPAEVKEKTWPLRVEQYALYENSEGPGKYRGGLGIVEDIRFLGERGEFTTWISRHKVPSWGVLGGGPPRCNCASINPGTAEERVVPRANSEPLGQGDVARLTCGGGAGYGDPLDRDPELVCYDVVRGLVSVERARAMYGVLLTGSSLGTKVDAEGTERLRVRLHAQGGVRTDVC